MEKLKGHAGRGASGRRGAGWVAAVAAATLLGGCEVDSFFDPSEMGRWENTPVVLPILERLDVIEEPEELIAGLSGITSEDLIPEVREYVMGPGDVITISIFELMTPGAESVQTRQIDELGYIRLPVVGEVRAAGLTTKQLEERLIDILVPEILPPEDPLVSVIVREGRQRTFSIIGTAGAGTYPIFQPNFRLLDAVAMARGIPPGTDRVYIIRQVPLADIVERGFDPVDLDHERPPVRVPDPDADAPDEQEDPLDPGALIEELMRGIEDDNGEQPEDAPPTGEAPRERTVPPLERGLDPQDLREGRYVNIDGRWVWVETDRPDGVPATEAPDELPAPEELVTQRVIEVDARALERGEARYNIVVRPGDVLRIPAPITGRVFVGGHVSRPGTYALPGEQSLTLRQLVISAGGLAPTGIPERVDLTRRIGSQQEATLRLNLRAIFEGVQPDIFLKPDDTINVGTHFFASHLAVMRNSFRFSYGMGFLLDRNFGADVFGATPGRATR